MQPEQILVPWVLDWWGSKQISPRIKRNEEWEEFRAIKVLRASDGKRRKQSVGVIPSEKWRHENTLEEQAVVGTYPPLPRSLEISEASPNLL